MFTDPAKFFLIKTFGKIILLATTYKTKSTSFYGMKEKLFWYFCREELIDKEFWLAVYSILKKNKFDFAIQAGSQFIKNG